MAYDEALADRVRAQLDDEPGLAAWVARGSDVARSLPPKSATTTKRRPEGRRIAGSA